MLTLTITPNGDLSLTADAAGLEWVREQREAERTDEEILVDGTEDYWANGNFRSFDAGEGNPFVGLTSAPCIAEDMNLHDDGTWEIVGRFWYYNAYAVRSYFDDLLQDGQAVFTRAPR